MNLLDTLKANNYALISSNGYYSTDTGIKPVISKINENRYFFKDLTVADKVIGKASAMLLALSGVKEIQTIVLSKAGQQVLEKYHIVYSYDRLADYIINRKGDDMCPMEKTVVNINDLNEAYEALNNKLKSMGIL